MKKQWSTQTVVVSGQDVRIDPKAIPDYVYNIAFRILAPKMREYFKDPQVQKEFEEWKAAQEAQAEKGGK